MTMSHAERRPEPGEYAPFYARYVALVPTGDVRDLLRDQRETFRHLPAAVRPERETFAYAAGKWTVRQVVSHLADAERVFGHRAYCISRGEQASLPGFDENEYVRASGADRRPLAVLADELALLREVNLRLLSALDDAAWGRVGVANGNPVSVRALAFVLVGHAEHHLEILRTRYGIDV